MANTVHGRAKLAEDDLCDFLTGKLRERLSMESGYCGDVTVEMRKAAKVFRLFSRITDETENPNAPAFISFEEFHHAFLRLNFIGQQRGLEALFRRYDFEGRGLLNIDRFVAHAFRTIPDSQQSSSIRLAFSNIRLALVNAAAKSIYAIHRFVQHCQVEAAGVGDGTLVSTADAKMIFATFGAKCRDHDLNAAVKEFDLRKKNAVNVNEIACCIRVPLSRTRRELAVRAWTAFASESDSSASMDAVVAAYAPAGVEAQKEMMEVLTAPGADSSDGTLTFNDFIELCRSVSAAVEGPLGYTNSENDFADWISGFGIDTSVPKVQSQLGGSVYAGLANSVRNNGYTQE